MSKSSSGSRFVPVIVLLGIGIVAAVVYTSKTDGPVVERRGNGVISTTDHDSSVAGPGEGVSLPQANLGDSGLDKNGVAGSTDTSGDEAESGEISLAKDGTGTRLSVRGATLDEVLEAFERDLGIDVVDLRPDDGPEPIGGKTKALSFSFSGDLDNLVRFVMNQYGYNYAISYYPVERSAEPSTTVKLFVYGSKLSKAAESVAEQAGERADEGAESTTGGAAGNTGAVQEKANIADVLRSRALSASQMQRPAPAPTGTSTPVTGDQSSATGETGTGTAVTYGSEDEKMKAQLLEMTRKARQEVEALVEGLKEAEKNLKQQSQP